MKYLVFLILAPVLVFGQNKLFFPMDLAQQNHLKAYGVMYRALKAGSTGDWLLNYRGGSFMVDYSERIALDARLAGVTFSEISFPEATALYSEVQSEDNNQDVVRLEKAPRIAVYVPPGFQPWDDAVTLALEFSGIEYTKIWNKEILEGKLSEYDWLHLHHEDFTGQYGKFFANYANAQWYIEQQMLYEANAKELGYKKVSDMLKNVAITIKNYVGQGGFLFAMCSATDSYDIALAATGVDIAERIFDGDAADPDAQNKLDFTQSLAFQNFTLEQNPMVYEYSDIDISPVEIKDFGNDYFSLFEFSAKYDPVPTMLTQNHTNAVKGFMGQTTMFRRNLIKPNVIILGERPGTDQVKYIHGNFGRGFFSFYGGHDPEDYQHAVSDPPTDLELFKQSPGYRLILNNILFPAAKKKKQKT